MAHYLKTEFYELIKKDESLFEFIQEGQSDGLWYRDLEKPDNEWMNKRFWDVLGYDADEMPLKTSAWQAIANQQDVEMADAALQKYLDDPSCSYDLQIRMLHKDGHMVYLNSNAIAIRDDKGKAIRLLGINQLIKSSESRENIKESRYKHLVETASDAIYLFDHKGTVIDANQTASIMIGRSIKKIIGKSIQIIDPNFNIKLFLDFWEKVPYDEQRIFETTHITKSGNLIPIEVSAKKFKDKDSTFYYGIARDITKRKEAEQEVKKQRDLFELVINSVPDRIFWKDLNSVYLGCNKHFAKDSGLDEISNVIGKTDQEMSWTKDARFYRADDRNVMDSGESRFSAEEPFFNNDGELVIWNTNKMPLKNNDGDIIGMVATSEDITHRRMAEQAIKESEEKFRKVFENANIGIAIGDKKGNVVDVNKGYLAITGYSYKEFVGINYSHYTHPDDLEKEAELLQDIRQGKRNSYRLEKRIKSKQGDYVWLDLSVTSIRNNKKQLESFIVLVIDVTERRKAAESLKVFFNQPMNIHLIAGVDGQIIRVNSGWKTILGYSRSEIEGMSFLDLVHSDDIEPTINEMKALDEGKTTLYFENRYRHKDGQYIWLAWSAIANTSSHQIHAIAKDITEEKLYHEALVKSEENYKALSENARHLIITYRFNGEISYANKYAVEFLQVPKENLIGADIKRFISDENETKKIESEADNGEKLKVQRSEVELTLPSGDRKVLDVLKSPIKIQRKIDSILITAYDISERKEAERKIKEQNEQYEALNEELKQSNEDLFKANQKHEEINERFDLALEATKDGLWDWNLLTNDLYLSPNWKKMIGYRDDELANDLTVWEKLTKVEDSKYALDKLNRLIEREIDKFDVEFKMRHKDGHWVDIHSRADIFFNEDGKAYRVVGTHSDITEKKRAENKIRESEEMLQLSIDNSPLGISKTDQNGNFISVNKAYEKIVGYTNEELCKLSFYDITDPAILPENRQLFESIMDNRIPDYHLEKRYIRKDGTSVDVRVHTGTIFDAHNQPLFAMSFIEDITEQKHLESRNRMLFKAIESSPVSVVITNAKGNIEYVNSFFSQMTGYTKIEAVGKNPRILKSGHHSRTYYEEMWEKLCHGESWAGEFLNKKKNGELYWENAIISPILNKDGKISQYIAIKEDITEQKKTLSELQLAKDKAEEANALKVEFLHNLSHEIRTPMNGIIGFAELLEELEETDDQQKNYISIIKNSSTQLLRVIDDILEISTLETKQLTVRKRVFDVNHFIMELFAIYDLKAKERKLSLFIKKGLENDNSQIVSDKVKINKVLSNLIDNAFKFTQEGQIEFGYTLDESNIVFFVKDTGIGITPEKQAKIFERFSQESTTTAQIYGGLGLGLSIAKENTELLGGYLTVESSKGKGATFYAHIPFVKHEEVDEQEVNKALPIKDKNDVVNILIAEDEEVNYLYLETVLDAIEEYKTKFHHAKNGKEAVKIALENDSIKLVLMDIKMPIMNGYTATQEIKAVKPELPIIAQTAYSTSLERDQALKHGCDDFISKPIKKEELILKVNKFLNQLNEN